MEKTTEISSTAEELLEGLTAPQKYVSSKYFYDTEGSRIFQNIMDMPEYYLTGCETEIFEFHGPSIGSLFCNGCTSLELVELGAGDGQKTRILIGELLRKKVNVRYIPVDISGEAVSQLRDSMKEHYPALLMEPQVGDYFHLLNELSKQYDRRRVIMFLGSNLGNFDRHQSISFLEKLNRSMTKNDMLFIGLDLKKDPELIRNAYDDPHGYTRDFNLNLLKRINRELGADFDLTGFRHEPCYDPLTGTAKSYLISIRDQSVHLAKIDEQIHFRQWETIFTEMSQKYDPGMIEFLAEASDFRVVKNFYDSQRYFTNSVWKRAL